MSIRVSLKDVACAAGVSISTASQALRGDGRISIKTREAVEKFAEQLGYRRDPLLSQFASRKFHHDGHMFGTTLLFVTAYASTNNAAAAAGNVPMYYTAFKKRAEKLGFRVEHVEMPQEFDYKKLQKQWFYSGVRGVIFGGVLRCQWLTEEPVPDLAIVSAGGSALNLTYHTVKSDVSSAVYNSWRKVRSRGYKKIGFAICRHENDIRDDRLRMGMAYCLAAADKSPIPVYTGPIGAAKPFIAWFKKYRPDAVIGFLGVVRYWMEEAGFRVPEDCAFAATTASADPNDFNSGWVENDDAIAVRAADYLDTMIRHGDMGVPSPPTVTLVEGSWKEGKTAPPVGAAAVAERKMAVQYD